MPLVAAIGLLFSFVATAEEAVDCEAVSGPIVKVSPSYKERWVPKEGATLVLSFSIGEDGLAENIEILESGGKKLDESAKKALERWFYLPKYAGCSLQETFEFSRDD